jgi:hypothetical protein
MQGVKIAHCEALGTVLWVCIVTVMVRRNAVDEWTSWGRCESYKKGSRWRMGVAGEWEALENGSR